MSNKVQQSQPKFNINKVKQSQTMSNKVQQSQPKLTLTKSNKV